MNNLLYKEHKLTIICLFIALFVASIIYFYILNKFNILDQRMQIEQAKNFISNVITFISITFGFYLTSISILFSSRYIKNMKDEDKTFSTQRQIHTIKNYFKTAIFFALLSIVIALLTSIILNLKFYYLTSVFLSSLIGMLAINFFFIYLLLKVFFNAFIAQAIGEK